MNWKRRGRPTNASTKDKLEIAAITKTQQYIINVHMESKYST